MPKNKDTPPELFKILVACSAFLLILGVLWAMNQGYFSDAIQPGIQYEIESMQDAAKSTEDATEH